MRLTRVAGIANRIRFNNQPPTNRNSPDSRQKNFSNSQALFAHSTLLRLQESLDELQGPVKSSRSVGVSGRPAEAASAISSLPLDLTEQPATAARFQSVEEINTTPTSYSTRGPEFGGNSTSVATLGGVYDGRNGTDTLTFTVTAGGIVGLSAFMSLNVTDGAGADVDSVDLFLYSPNSQRTLANGMTVQFQSGTLTSGDSFSVDVADATGTAVKPNNPFNGIRTQNPELDPGTSVTSGSFQINGQSIAVLASDSINSIIAKINASAADVTAAFNAATDRIEFVQDTSGAAPTIDLNSDTSGFLVATKLDSAQVVNGTDLKQDWNAPLNTVAQFSSVNSGSIWINGETISIDVQYDSLNAILDRITQSGAGVVAEFDSSRQRASTYNLDSSATLNIDDNGTNFFSALNIDSGVLDPVEAVESTRKRVSGMSRRAAREFVDQLESVAERFSQLFNDTKLFEAAGQSIQETRNEFRVSVARSFDSLSSRIDSGLGINFDFAKGEKGVFSIDSAERRQIEKQLRQDPSKLNLLLFGDKENIGLVETLKNSLDRADQRIIESQVAVGSFLDIIA